MATLPPNAPELLSDDQPQVPGAFGGTPRTRKSKKKTKTRRQLEQVVRAELGFARNMRNAELHLLMTFRNAQLRYLADPVGASAYERRNAEQILVRWPYMADRDPDLTDVADRTSWRESSYHKVAAEFENLYGPLPEDLILENP